MGSLENIFLDHAWAIAIGCFVCCLMITGIQVFKHLSNYTNPHFQNKIITILLFAPSYALCSAMTIWFKDTTGYIDMIRDVYEAVLLYAFFELLRSYIAYDEDLKIIDQEKIYQILSVKGIRHHIPPMNWIQCNKPIKLISEIRARWFFQECKRGVLQFMPCILICTFIELIAITAQAPSIIADLCNAVLFASTCVSLYYLVMFYQVLNLELIPYRPLLKFLSIKGVLFFTYWQALALNILSNEIAKYFENKSYSPELINLIFLSLLENFEMVILSIITAIAFSHKDFKDSQTSNSFFKKTSVSLIGKKFRDVVKTNILDTMGDLKEFAEPLGRDKFTIRNSKIEQKTSFPSSGSEDESIEQKSNLYDKIVIIPDSIGQVRENGNETGQILYTTSFRQKNKYLCNF